jgi:hypothetical protein
MSRMSVLLSLALLITPLTAAKDKAPLPAYVLSAQTVVVVIHPDAGEPLSDLNANRKALEDVEKALVKWGHFRLVMESQTADLVITVRKGSGRAVSPTIKGGPIDNRPVVLQPNDSGGIRVGVQRGHPPDLTQRPTAGPKDTGPRIGTEAGAAEDMLEVYRGGTEYPLDGPVVWRYMAKDALRSPDVPAVQQFQKAVEQTQKVVAEKQAKKKP